MLQNVFLTKRKKEIGVYVFMGLTNQRIGKLYMLETMLIGLVALVMGIGFGILISQLFTMTLVTISDIEVNLSFEISLSAILWEQFDLLYCLYDFCFQRIYQFSKKQCFRYGQCQSSK